MRISLFPLVGRLIHQFLVLSHQGFGDAAADGKSAERPLSSYLHMHDHARSPLLTEWLLVAQKQIQVQHLRLSLWLLVSRS